MIPAIPARAGEYPEQTVQLCPETKGRHTNIKPHGIIYSFNLTLLEVGKVEKLPYTIPLIRELTI